MSDQPTRDGAVDTAKRQLAKSPLEILKILDPLAHTGRNDLCPCGSGRTYKKCCLPQDEARAHKAALAQEELKTCITSRNQVGEPPDPTERDANVVDVGAKPLVD